MKLDENKFNNRIIFTLDNTVLSNFSKSNTMNILYNYVNKFNIEILITSAIQEEYKRLNRVIELKFEIIEIAKNEISALKRAIIANEGNCKLGKGELSCILLSLNSDIDIIFTDDKAACKYIKQNLNIKISGTLGLLKMMYDDGYLSKEKIVSISEKMKNEGYWISDKLYSDFIENL